jgi:hypothetical protein
MVDSMINPLDDLRRSWSHAVTSLVWGQWLMLDTGFQATQSVLATAAPSAEGPASTAQVGLLDLALARIKKGLAPPREIYLAPYRDQVDWTKFPDWARPSDPELFEGCGHEG